MWYIKDFISNIQAYWHPSWEFYYLLAFSVTLKNEEGNLQHMVDK